MRNRLAVISLIVLVLIVVASNVTGCDTTTRYKLSISCEPAEAGSVRRFGSWDTLHKSYPEGEVVKLEAYGNTGSTCYDLERWSGCVSSNSTVVSITMDSDKAIVAHFRKALSGKVWTEDGSYIADCYVPIILINNPSAVNPTYSQLLSFLKQDRTESNPYTGGCSSAIPCPFDRRDVLDELNREYEEAKAAGIEIDRPSVCSEYAEMLHNNAEKAGIRAGYVMCTDHAMNVFETTDRGLVNIDDTGFVWSFDGIDKLATIGPDGRITLTPLWPEDQAKYVSVDFPTPVYFERIVWWGGLTAECQE
jgi:hypothetical protein